MDNLRRELSRENRPAPSWFNPSQSESLGIQLAKPDEFSTHIVAFGKLPAQQQEIAGCAIEAFGAQMEASVVTISFVMKGKSKAKKSAKLVQEAANETFVVTGAVLVGTIIDDMAAKRNGFWQWFQEFYASLDRQSKFAWSDFADTLLGESLQLWFAQQLADTPEGVARWRKYLTTDNWE